MADTLSTHLIDELKAEFTALKHGTRSQWVQQTASKLGIHPSTVYSYLGLNKKTVSRASKKENLTDKIRVIARMKFESAELGKQDRANRFLRTEDCIRMLIQSGYLKGRVEGTRIVESELSVSYVDELLRKQGFRDSERSYRRREDEYVNEAHYLDWSVSKYFGKPRRTADGDWEIHVDRSGYEYDAKSDGKRVKLWVINYVDSVSRAQLTRYVVATGENTVAAVEALSFFWQRENDPFHPMRHLPLNQLRIDQGSLKSSHFVEPSQQFLNFRVITGESKSNRYKHGQSQGKVERRFRQLWTYEHALAYDLLKKGHGVIRLSEMNHLVHAWNVQLLDEAHPMKRSVTRRHVYLTGLNMQEQRICNVDLNAIYFKQQTRRADPSGIIWVDNQPYEVPERFCNQTIRIYIDNHGVLRGSNTVGTDHFDIVPFDIMERRGSRTHLPSFRETIMTDGTLQVPTLNTTIVPEPAAPAPVLTLPPKVAELVPETPFTPKVAQPFKSLNEAKLALIEALGVELYADVPEGIRRVFERIAERDMNELTQGLIDDLARVAV